MHLTVRQTLSRAHTHTQADTPDKHQNVTKLHPDSECHRDTYLYFIMLPSSPETHLRSKRACRYSESSHLPSNNSVFHCRAADAVFSPSSRSPLSLSLSPPSPSLFLLSLSPFLSFSLSLSDWFTLSKCCASTAGNENCLRHLQVDGTTGRFRGDGLHCRDSFSLKKNK